jgi:hypothetical protein
MVCEIRACRYVCKRWTNCGLLHLFCGGWLCGVLGAARLSPQVITNAPAPLPTLSLFTAWLSKITPDGVLTVAVLLLQLYIIWRGSVASQDAEKRAQRHDKISVQPALEFTTFHDSNVLRVTMTNFGAGPATVMSQAFIIDGRTYMAGQTPDPREGFLMLLQQIGLQSENLVRLNQFAPKTWMGSGQEMGCFEIALPKYNHEQALALRNRIRVQVKYESLYGEPFEADLGFTHPQNPQAPAATSSSISIIRTRSGL